MGDEKKSAAAEELRAKLKGMTATELYLLSVALKRRAEDYFEELAFIEELITLAIHKARPKR